jgi:periplasmic divalent cation tolerance protein
VSASNPATPEIVEVATTVSSEEEAATLARTLVEEGLAACVSFFPVRSLYRWKGELCDEQEVYLAIKTSGERVEELEARVREEHPYETPAVLRTPVLRADEAYAAWVVENVRGAR